MQEISEQERESKSISNPRTWFGSAWRFVGVLATFVVFNELVDAQKTNLGKWTAAIGGGAIVGIIAAVIDQLPKRTR